MVHKLKVTQRPTFQSSSSLQKNKDAKEGLIAVTDLMALIGSRGTAGENVGLAFE